MASSSSGSAKVVENVFRTATETNQTNSSPSSSPSKSNTNNANSTPPTPHAYDVRHWSKSRALNTMRLCNCCNGCCLIIGAIIAFLIPTGTLLPSAATVTLASYVILLGILMMCAECNLMMLQRRLRNNFGFMFTYIGRALYIFFTATVAVALGNQSNYLMWSIGGITVLNSIFNAVIIFWHPSFISGEIKRDADPSQISSTAEEAMKSYILANPQVATQVIAGGIAVATTNTVAPPSSAVTTAATTASHIPVSFLSHIMGENKPSSSSTPEPTNMHDRGARIARASGKDQPSHSEHPPANIPTNTSNTPSGAQYNPFGNTSLASSMPASLPPARPLGSSSSTATTSSTPSNTAAYNPFHRATVNNTTIPSQATVVNNYAYNQTQQNHQPTHTHQADNNDEPEGENPFL